MSKEFSFNASNGSFAGDETKTVIHGNFKGGNIAVVKKTGNDIYLKNELRDTSEDWFYWAFCIENANGQTLTFHFDADRLGYFGPAVSRDLSDWSWLNNCSESSFTYTFAENESKVYFAHHMLYNTDRFFSQADRYNIDVKELCKTRKGRSVPYIEFGEGNKTVILAARHHACESTGNYVLEGILQRLSELEKLDYHFIIIPFVDYDGVIDGDQGKYRSPHDHSADYTDNPIYPEIQAIIQLAKTHSVVFGGDFHSPWHKGGENDTCFISCNDTLHNSEYKAFGDILESKITADSFDYKCMNNHLFGIGWNTSTGRFGNFMNNLGAKVAFTLETPYFGTQENPFTQERAVKLGNCFCEAMLQFLR